MRRPLPRGLSAQERSPDSRGRGGDERRRRVPPDLVDRYVTRCRMALAEGNAHHLHAIADDFAADLEESGALANVTVRTKAASLSTPLSQLGLSTRCVNRLEEHGIYTLGALLNTSRESLLELPEFGPAMLGEVLAAVERAGHFVKPPDDPQNSGAENIG